MVCGLVTKTLSLRHIEEAASVRYGGWGWLQIAAFSLLQIQGRGCPQCGFSTIAEEILGLRYGAQRLGSCRAVGVWGGAHGMYIAGWLEYASTL